MKYVLLKFGGSVLALSHLFKYSDTIFTPFLKCSRLEVLNITLMSCANKTGLYLLLIILDTSFIQSGKHKGTTVAPLGTPCFVSVK
jgi:hypothetical protein